MDGESEWACTARVGLPQHQKMLYQAIVEWNCAKSLSFVVATVLLHMPARKPIKSREEDEKQTVE